MFFEITRKFWGNVVECHYIKLGFKLTRGRTVRVNLHYQVEKCIIVKTPLYVRLLWFAFYCCDKYHNQKQLVEETVCCILNPSAANPSLSDVRTGPRGWNPEARPKA